MNEIEKLQNNMLLFRRILGWNAEEFGEKIGVTRQTINNLETGRNKLSKTQYLAIRCVFDAEILNNENETEMLKILLDMLIDNPENYDEKYKEELLNKANIMAPAILAGAADRENISIEWSNIAKKLFPLCTIIPVAGTIVFGTWALNKSNKKNGG